MYCFLWINFSPHFLYFSLLLFSSLPTEPWQTNRLWIILFQFRQQLAPMPEAIFLPLFWSDYLTHTVVDLECSTPSCVDITPSYLLSTGAKYSTKALSCWFVFWRWEYGEIPKRYNHQWLSYLTKQSFPRGANVMINYYSHQCLSGGL